MLIDCEKLWRNSARGFRAASVGSSAGREWAPPHARRSLAVAGRAEQPGTHRHPLSDVAGLRIARKRSKCRFPTSRATKRYSLSSQSSNITHPSNPRSTTTTLHLSITSGVRDKVATIIILYLRSKGVKVAFGGCTIEIWITGEP
ncbi:hypothetical protein ACFL5Z_06460 [Planctomycetota bacterium]